MAVSSTSPRTAILLFSHAPGREWTNKWFVPGDATRNCEVAEALLTHTQATTSAAALPVVHLSDDRQRGATFGERFVNALADGFAEGYDHLIVVGNDCPELGAVDFAAVAQTLHAGRPVVGPTPKGGAYLIGLSRTHFSAEALRALPYQTTAFLNALQTHLVQHVGHAPVVLAPRDDLNSRADLRRFLRQRAPAGVAAWLVAHLRFLLRARNVVHRLRGRRLAHQHLAHPLSGRGPPLRRR